jgi:ABC-type branched-subunit amino acid transport system substrate-binding protein
MKIKTFCVSFSVLMTILASPVPSNAETVVKIGHVASLTGGIAHLGKDNEDGARLAVEEINATGFDGRRPKAHVATGRAGRCG